MDLGIKHYDILAQMEKNRAYRTAEITVDRRRDDWRESQFGLKTLRAHGLVESALSGNDLLWMITAAGTSRQQKRIPRSNGEAVKQGETT